LGLEGLATLDRRWKSQRLTRLEPMPHAQRIADARELAGRVEQDDDERPAPDRREHHEALARLANVAGLRKLDVPLVVLDQIVRVVEREKAAARASLDEMAAGRAELA